MKASFPDDFLFGCATASYQVEGAVCKGGRGLSIWDTFCAEPGRVLNDDNADVSADQYHRYQEDVELMDWLGLGAYRFSVSWSRILPEGRGTVNSEGVDYYDRLIDALLEKDIEPWMTLFHWDLPQVLQAEYGGWLSPKITDDFAAYAGILADKFSDRVKNFFTINEFSCFIDKGYSMGDEFDAFAPGLQVSKKELCQARHYALLAHGKAVQALRACAKQPIKIGIAENPEIHVPVIEKEDDILAARKAFRESNAHYLTAIMEGRYLDQYLEDLGEDIPEFSEAEMSTISEPLDFLGSNMYSPKLTRAADNECGYESIPYSKSHPNMVMWWLRLGPQLTYWAPRFVKELWDVDAFYITENGCAADDHLDRNGEVLDTDRLMYLRQHFLSAARAVEEGWPLKGYFVWSLLDNFEWAHGLSRRFGITYVNFKTLERTPKLSAKWYREVIRTRRVC
ncbi:MAG: GH1 family beta-glucosidase [Verrucomicrobiota bacterium]